jgi:hypothetical protein
MTRDGTNFGKIRREHVEQACRSLVAVGPSPGGGSYFVQFEGHDLPAKRVLRDAYRYANDCEIDAKKFSGGQYTAGILRQLGFEVIVR